MARIGVGQVAMGNKPSVPKAPRATQSGTGNRGSIQWQAEPLARTPNPPTPTHLAVLGALRAVRLEQVARIEGG